MAYVTGRVGATGTRLWDLEILLRALLWTARGKATPRRWLLRVLRKPRWSPSDGALRVARVEMEAAGAEVSAPVLAEVLVGLGGGDGEG